MYEKKLDPFEGFKWTWWDRLKFWWSQRKKSKCDSCNGTFRLRELTPTSGDWWLCDKCFNEMMRALREDLCP